MRKLAGVLIIGGIICLSIPPLGKWYTQQQQTKMYKAYEVQMAKRVAGMQELNVTLEEIEEAQPQEVADPLSDETPNGLEVLGLLSLPTLEAEMMWVEGVSDQALKYAAGHMPGTALPGEVGNCSIAGHRSYTFGKYFNRLDELEPGDEIRITYGTEEYIYEVYESFLVLPTEVEVIEPQGDEPVVTLITCHPVINPTHRLIVRGKLVKN